MTLRPIGRVLALVVVTTAACGGGPKTPTAPVPTTTNLTLQAEAGHPLLSGQTRRFTPEQVPFSAGVDCYENHLELRVGTASGGWTVALGAPRGRRLAPGTYTNASTYPFNLFSDSPGIRIGGEGRGCDDTGAFVVTTAAYAVSGAIERFRATFEHRCERFPAALRGEVELVFPPGGQVSCP